MAPDFISVVAKVISRSEGRGEETPVAVIIGDDRFEIVDVPDRAVVTSVEAGQPVRHRFWVELEDGRRCVLTRSEPDGEWRVDIHAANV
jgi:hypothetical protein